MGGEAKVGGWSLRRRLVVLLVIMILPFVGFLFYSARDINRSLVAEYQEKDLALARSVAYSIDENIESSEELLNAIAKSDAARNGDVDALNEWFESIIAHCDHYANVVYFDTDGDLLASGRTPEQGARVNVAEKPWFQESMESTELAIGGFAIAKIGGIPDVHLSLPVFDRAGRRIGVVSIAMHLTRVQTRLMREKTPEHTTITVIDRTGTVVARNHDPEKWVGTDASELFGLKEMSAEHEGESAAVLADGTELVCVFTEASLAPWFVRVGVDADHIAQVTQERVRDHYTLFVPLLLIALGGWMWIGRDVDRLHLRTEELTRIDALTGLWNNRCLHRDLEHAVQHALRSGESLALAMLDLDDFKSYNDRYGHVAGDQALRAVSRAIAGSVRVVDRVYRYGGEEFCALLPDTGPEGAAAVAERIRASVAEVALQPDPNDSSVRMSISIGVAMLPDDAASVDDLMNCADTALYRAKSEGKNRVVVHCPESCAE